MLQSITGWLIDAFHGLQTFLIHFFQPNDSDFCVDNLFSNQYAAFMKTKYCYRAILKCARVDGLSHAVWIMGLIDFLLSSTETEASKSKRTLTFVLGSQAYHIEIGRSTWLMVQWVILSWWKQKVWCTWSSNATTELSYDPLEASWSPGRKQDFVRR